MPILAPARRQTGWARWLPGLQTLRHYEVAWLRHDLVAGLALTAVLVPIGIAYAVASGVSAISGLYATIFGLLVYAVFGPSRVLVLGPDSSLVPLVLGVVLPLSAGDPQHAMALAGMMALVSGGLCILAGVARLGFVTELLSKPIRHGYMNGIALTVFISQLPALFGFTAGGEGLLDVARAFGVDVLAGRTNGASLAIGAGTLAALWALRHHKRFPGVLIAVAGATAIVMALDLSRRAGVSVVGPMPKGLPVLAFPSIGSHDVSQVFLGGLAVALVSFADTSVLSRAFATRARTAVDANQEMVGLGAANLAAGMFQGFPISASASRTPVAEAAGARTQLAGVVGALGVALLVMFAPNLLEELPRSALAAVVIAAAVALIEIDDLRRIFRIQRWEFWLSMVCLAGVVVLGPMQGIALAIVIAVIEFLWEGWRPYSAVLGRVDGLKGYHDITRHPQARRIPGLVLLRWDAPLFFANAELFRDRVLAAAAASPTPVRRLVVDAEPITSVDVTAADIVDELDATLHAAGIELCFAELKDPVKDKLKQFGLFARLGEQKFFPTIGQAVNVYLEDHPVGWVDWEDTDAGPQAKRMESRALESHRLRPDVHTDGSSTMAVTYAFGKSTALKHDEAVARVTEELAKEGFGVLTEIDVAATMKKKLGLDMPPYRILGACNPQFAHRALAVEPQIGALLPCNVVVRTDAAGTTVVEVMDPGAVLGLVGRAEIAPIAAEVRARLERMLNAV